jgi:hypothetical protein
MRSVELESSPAALWIGSSRVRRLPPRSREGKHGLRAPRLPERSLRAPHSRPRASIASTNCIFPDQASLPCIRHPVGMLSGLFERRVYLIWITKIRARCHRPFAPSNDNLRFPSEIGVKQSNLNRAVSTNLFRACCASRVNLRCIPVLTDAPRLFPPVQHSQKASPAGRRVKGNFLSLCNHFPLSIRFRCPPRFGS